MHPELLTPVLQIIHRVIATYLIKHAGVKRSEAATGTVTLIQRFGSAPNLNIHIHGLVLDGVYCTGGEGAPFHQAPAPTNDQLQRLLDKIIRRILKLLTRLGHLIEEEGVTYLARTESIDPDNVLTPLQAVSSTYRIVMSPLEFMQRLAALVPRPRLHLIRFHGVLAPNAKLRSRVVPAPVQSTPVGEGDCTHTHAHSAPVRMSWARLLKRVYDIDIERCVCGGKLKISAVIEEQAVIEKILTHLGLAAQPPPIAPARRQAELFEWA